MTNSQRVARMDHPKGLIEVFEDSVGELRTFVNGHDVTTQLGGMGASAVALAHMASELWDEGDLDLS